MVSLKEFIGTIYYVQDYIKIPLLDMKLENIKYLKKNKWDFNKLNNDLEKLYEQNIEKFK